MGFSILIIRSTQNSIGNYLGPYIVVAKGGAEFTA